MRFKRVIGIDYSGAGTDAKPATGLAAWVADRQGVHPVEEGTRWSRDALTARLMDELADGRVLVVIDHAFAYSAEVLDRLGVRHWEQLPRRLDALGSLTALRERAIDLEGWRLTDWWAPGTQDPLGIRTYRPVSHSTFHGIRHLGRLRASVAFHLWPFDGWDPPAGAAVVAEGFPHLVRRRVAATGATRDERDAEALARFFSSRDRAGLLDAVFHPPLTRDERARARREGWILGLA